MEAGRATFSGFLAANVLGVVSAKTRMTKVRVSEAKTIESSPQSLMAKMVAILEAKILTKLLPSRIVPIKWSVSLSKRSVLLAFLLVRLKALRR